WEDAEGEEAQAPARGGLSGLLASIIPRSTPRRVRDEDADYPDLPPPGGDGEPAPGVQPDLSNPLLAVKGRASAAPPTDPAALNHEVRAGFGSMPPEPVPGDGAAAPMFS